MHFYIHLAVSLSFQGPIKVIYPGLNERVTLDSDTIPDAVQVAPPDTDFEKNLGERIDSKSSRRFVHEFVKLRFEHHKRFSVEYDR